MGDDFFVRATSTRAEQYIKEIACAPTKFEAANLIRAHACQVASSLGKSGYTPTERIAIIELAEERADMLEKLTPWYDWVRLLSEWGYTF